MEAYLPPLDGRPAYEGLLLDFNERSISPSDDVVQALKAFISSKKTQIYPTYGDLEKKIAAYVGTRADQVMITNGSDQGIDIIFRTFAEKGDKVIIPSPSFAMFFQSAQVNGNEIVKPLYRKDNLDFPLNEVLAAIDKRTKLIIVCNPNNPTGTAVSLADIAKIAKNAKGAIVCVDEAYYEFSKITAIPLIRRYPNIVVTRTFSKAFGLAALRIGYVVARAEYRAEMSKVRGPYDVNMAAYVAACKTLEDTASMEKYVNDVMKNAKPLVESFFAQRGIRYFSSRANFILFRPESSKQVKKVLEKNGVLVRPQNKKNIENTLRVSIGTTKQMKKFIAIYKKTVREDEKRKYAFLDRDGTLIFEPQDTYQIDSIKRLKILEGVVEGLQELKSHGYRLIMVSNQDGLGAAAFPKKKFEKPQKRMLKIFREKGIKFDNIFICPHTPEARCGCRKPKTGLVDELLDEGIDKSKSFVCGDRKSDRQFARNIGVRFASMKTNGNFYEAIKLLLFKSI